MQWLNATRVGVCLLAIVLGGLDARADDVEPDATLGTKVTWERSPARAFEKARAKEKLVLLLHLSGNFDSTELT